MSVRRYAKKQYNRAKSWAKNRYTGKGSLRRVIRDVAKVKSLLNVETKFRDVDHTPVPTSSAWHLMDNIMDITQGTTPTGRDGNQVKIKSLQLKGYVERSGTASVPNTSSNFLRMVVFIDKDPVIGAPSQFGTPATSIFTSSNPWSLMDMETKFTKRFTILADKSYKMDIQVPTIMLKYYKSLSMRSRWSTALANSLSNNKLYVAFLTDCPAATVDFTIKVQSRVTYIDN